MTREETKEAAEVMLAYANGKKIEFYDKDSKCRVSMDNYPPVWDWFNTNYRIAPDQEEPKEKHYRPYTMEEFVQAMHKHDGFIKCKHHSYYGYSINCIGYYGCILNDNMSHSYTELMNYFVWSDDLTPCGKEVTE